MKFKLIEAAESKICCICKKPFNGYGNNPDPVCKTGRCCDECNMKKVIPARIKMLNKSSSNKLDEATSDAEVEIFDASSAPFDISFKFFAPYSFLDKLARLTRVGDPDGVQMLKKLISLGLFQMHETAKDNSGKYYEVFGVKDEEAFKNLIEKYPELQNLITREEDSTIRIIKRDFYNPEFIPKFTSDASDTGHKKGYYHDDGNGSFDDLGESKELNEEINKSAETMMTEIVSKITSNEAAIKDIFDAYEETRDDSDSYGGDFDEYSDDYDMISEYRSELIDKLIEIGVPKSFITFIHEEGYDVGGITGGYSYWSYEQMIEDLSDIDIYEDYINNIDYYNESLTEAFEDYKITYYLSTATAERRPETIEDVENDWREETFAANSDYDALLYALELIDNGYDDTDFSTAEEIVKYFEEKDLGDGSAFVVKLEGPNGVIYDMGQTKEDFIEQVKENDKMLAYCRKLLGIDESLNEANIYMSKEEMNKLDQEVEEATKEVAKYNIPMKAQKNSAGDVENVPDFESVPEDQRNAAKSAYERYKKALEARPDRAKNIIVYDESLNEDYDYDPASQNGFLNVLIDFLNQLNVKSLVTRSYWGNRIISDRLVKDELIQFLDSYPYEIGTEVTHAHDIGNNNRYPIIYNGGDTPSICAYLNINQGLYGECYINIETDSGQIISKKYMLTERGGVSVRPSAKVEELNEASSDPYFTPYGYRAAAKVLNRTAPQYYWHLKEIEMDRGDGIKLANYALKKGMPVMLDKESEPDYPEFYLKDGLSEYHWNDYFYPYGTTTDATDFVPYEGNLDILNTEKDNSKMNESKINALGMIKNISREGKQILRELRYAWDDIFNNAKEVYEIPGIGIIIKTYDDKFRYLAIVDGSRNMGSDYILYNTLEDYVYNSDFSESFDDIKEMIIDIVPNAESILSNEQTNESLNESINDDTIELMRRAIDAAFSNTDITLDVEAILRNNNANEDDSDRELGYFKGMSDEDIENAYSAVRELIVSIYTKRDLPQDIRKAFSFDYIENDLDESLNEEMSVRAKLKALYPELNFGDKVVEKLDEAVDSGMEEQFQEMKQWLMDNESTITGREFAYDGPYVDLVDTCYSEAYSDLMEDYNEFSIDASIQNGEGCLELFMETDEGTLYNSWDFESDCENLLDIAFESDSAEEFISGIKNYIAGFIEDSYFRDEDDDYDDEDEIDDDTDFDIDESAEYNLMETLYNGADFDDHDDEDEIDYLYHDASEEELRKMGAFDNLSDEEEDPWENDLISDDYDDGDMWYGYDILTGAYGEHFDSEQDYIAAALSDMFSTYWEELNGSTNVEDYVEKFQDDQLEVIDHPIENIEYLKNEVSNYINMYINEDN